MQRAAPGRLIARLVVLLAFLLGLGSTAQACKFELRPEDHLLSQWAADCTHPLCGRIVAIGQVLDGAPDAGGSCAHEKARFRLRAELAAIGAEGDAALIGEVHDNPAHHRLRSALLGSIAGVANPPAIVFEHVRADQQKGLDEFKEFNAKARRLGNADDLFRFLDWEHSGWPDQKIFAPLFEAVIRTKAPIYAGDPARADIKKVAKEGEAALPEAERQRLGLDKPLPGVAQEGLLDKLEQSHCGLMPKTAFGNLAYAQRYRDAHLADVVLQAAAKHGSAILFAGNGHVRSDRGVPYYLRQRAPDKKIVTVLLLEVEDGKDKPEDYEIKSADGQPLADYVVFTPRAERPDPCDEMKKAFEKRSAR